MKNLCPIVIACMALIVSSACSTTPRKAHFYGLLRQADSLSKERKPQPALQVLEKAHRMAPKNPLPIHLKAQVFARQGLHNQAIEALRQALALGDYCFIPPFPDDEFSVLQQEPDFKELLKKAESDTAAWLYEWRAVHREVPSDRVPLFRQGDALVRHYEETRKKQAAAEWTLSGADSIRRKWRLLDEEIAAIKKYLVEHPGAPDREQMAFRLLQAMFQYKDPNPMIYWADDGPLAAATADQFLSSFPTSPRAPDARYLAVLGHWLSRPFPADPQRALILDPEQVEKTVTQFDQIVSQYPGTEAEGRALYATVVLCYYRDGQRPSAETKARFARLIADWGDQPAFSSITAAASPKILSALTDWSAFEAVDTSGTTWKTAELRGQVVLIVYWATWCGPCVAELPAINDLAKEFQGQGLKVLGVNLDEGNPEKWADWLQRHHVDWPQVHDGKGWESPLVRVYRVENLPFHLLLDREGNVVPGSASRSGPGLKEAVRAALAAGTAAPADRPSAP